ncbi:MAG: tetratricopeptide repeat protein [Gemmatimonadota bacterium]
MKDDARRFFALAMDAAKMDDVPEVISALQQGLALDPAQPFFWAWLGKQYNEREQYAAACDAFARAISLDPNQALAYTGCGEAMAAIGKVREAEAAYRTSVELGPAAYRFVLLGNVQESLGMRTEAEASFRQALRLDPRDEEAMFNLALLLKASKPQEAERLLRNAIEIDPDYSVALAELGFHLGRRGTDGEAEVLIRRSIELDPSLPWPRIYLANLLRAQGNYKAAASELEIASELAPDIGLTHRWLGDCYSDLDDLAQAEFHFRRAVAVDPDDPECAFSLGEFLLERGQKHEAMQWLDRAAKCGNSMAERVGELLLESGLDYLMSE